MRVGDHSTEICTFSKVNSERTRLEIKYNIIDSGNELDNHIMGTGFGRITKMQIDQKGKVFNLSLENENVQNLLTF